MKKFTFKGIIASIFLVAISATNSFSQGTPIGCDGKFFVSYSATSNSATRIDSLGFSGAVINDYLFQTNNSSVFNAVGINPLDGYMYGISNSGNLIKVGRNAGPVPPNNHVVTDLGAISPNPGSSVYAGCFDSNGDFYFTYGTTFRKIPNALLNTTRVSTALPNLNGSGDNTPAGSGDIFLIDLAISPLDGKMYGVSYGTGSTTANFSYRLYEINKTSGALTRLGAAGNNTTGQYLHPSNQYIAALFFTEDGKLYGYRQDNQFLQINLTAPQSSTNAGNGKSYAQADGCSCAFGRVFHDLDFTANPGNQLCPTSTTPNPTFPMVVTVTNQSVSQQTGLTYTLNISDPNKRFRFTENAATIKTNLIAAGVATGSSTVTLSTELPATGTNYNKIVVTGFQTGAPLPVAAKVFTLQVQLYTLGGTYTPIPLQSLISGLPLAIGSNDLSNDPTSVTPDDATIINFCNNITLPVKLLSFTGAYKNNATLLNWVAENQVNFSYYDIERSTDGTNFSSIGLKAVTGNSSTRENYQFNDDLSSFSASAFYYRLKMIDTDGNFKYSNIILIRKDQKGMTDIAIIPNPVVKGNTVTLRFESAVKSVVDIKVIDMAGRIMFTQQNNATQGINSVSIYHLERLHPGMYLLQMNDGSAVQTTKFTIAR